MKKWIVRISVILLLLIIGVFVYIELNKKELIQAGIDEFNDTIDGELKYGDVQVSLLRSFPDLKISLLDITLSSNKGTTDRNLLEADKISTNVDLISAFRPQTPIEVKSLKIEGANLFLVSMHDGSSNYDLFYNEPTNAERSSVDFNIQDFSVSSSHLFFVDQLSNTEGRIDGLNLEGAIKFSDDNIQINSSFSTILGLKQSKLVPAYEVNLSANSELLLNSSMEHIDIGLFSGTINDLPLEISGKVDMSQPGLAYDLDISSPSTEIKRLISLIPSYYSNDYTHLISKGTYSLAANINTDGSGRYPLYKMFLTAKDGGISYAKLGHGIDHLSLSLTAENNSSNTPYSSIVIDDLKLRSGDSHLSGSFSSIEEFKHHKTSFDLQSNLNLADLKKGLVTAEDFVLEGIIEGHLNGSAIVNSQTSKSVINEDAFDANLEFSNLKYASSSNNVSVRKASILGDKEKLTYSVNDLAYREAANLAIDGHFLRPLSILVDSTATIRGQSTITSDKIDLNTLASTDTTSQLSYDIPNIDLDVSFVGSRLVQSTYTFEDINFKGKLKNVGSNGAFTIGSFEGSKISGDVILDNLLEYALNSDTLKGDIVVKADQVSLDPFLLSNQDTTGVVSNEPLIPSNLDLNVEFATEAVSFKNIEILQALGQVKLQDQKFVFKNEGDIFGGQVVFSGTFDSKRDKGYHIGLNLNLVDLQFAETANKIKFFSKLIPIAKLLEGAYSSTLSWDSDLDEFYIPDLNSLSAYGEIETQDGSINGFLPLDTFIRKIVSIHDDHEVKINDTKRYFLVEEGKVIVKEVVLQRDDIVIALSGTHSFSQET